MSPYSNRLRSDEGFTLLEVAFVVLIMAILLTIAVATFAATTGAATSAVCRENQDAFDQAIVIALSEGVVVDDIADLEPYLKNFDSVSTCPEDGTPLVFDGTTNRVTCPNHP